MSETSAETMGMPPEGEDVPVQGQLPGDMDGYEFARPVANPADPTEGEEPGYITRASEKHAAGSEEE